MFIIIDINKENVHKVYSFETKSFSEESCTRLKYGLMSCVRNLSYNVDISTSDTSKGEVVKSIPELVSKVSKKVLRKTINTAVYETIEVPISYKLYVDPINFIAIVGTFSSSSYPFVSISSNNKVLKYDRFELLKALKNEGFDADVSTTDCVYIRQGEIELVDEYIVFTAVTKTKVCKNKKTRIII